MRHTVCDCNNLSLQWSTAGDWQGLALDAADWLLPRNWGKYHPNVQNFNLRNTACTHWADRRAWTADRYPREWVWSNCSTWEGRGLDAKWSIVCLWGRTSQTFIELSGLLFGYLVVYIWNRIFSYVIIKKTWTIVSIILKNELNIISE